MQKVRQKVIGGHLLLLGSGALIGWLYGHVDWGILVAALLGWAGICGSYSDSKPH